MLKLLSKSLSQLSDIGPVIGHVRVSEACSGSNLKMNTFMQYNNSLQSILLAMNTWHTKLNKMP